MVFTNITNAGIYMQCCHREVEPGGSFRVPWLEARGNRPLRKAMEDKSFVWESQEGEPNVPGSPDDLWASIKKARAERAAKAAAAKKAEEERLAKQELADQEAMKANMAGMGDFNVPKVDDFKVKARTVKKEKPITSEDVIKGGAPKSLADIRRHNRAIRQTGN